jgi:uroporphyrinogen decarboxylase
MGHLSPADYAEYVMPYTLQAVAIARTAGVPVIHFGTNNRGLLEMIGAEHGDVIGVDWRSNIGDAWSLIGDGVAVQGNLDPIALFAPPAELEKRAQAVLDSVDGRPGHIFNLGHGIVPGTPVDNVKRLVDYVHEATRGKQTVSS